MKKKASQAKPKPRVYFEQVPLKVVKKIIGRESKTPKAGLANVIVEHASEKIEPYSVPFRDLAPRYR